MKGQYKVLAEAYEQIAQQEGGAFRTAKSSVARNADYYSGKFKEMVSNIINANTMEEFVAAANKHFTGFGKKNNYDRRFQNAIEEVLRNTQLFSEDDLQDIQLVLYWAIRSAWEYHQKPQDPYQVVKIKDDWSSWKQAYDHAKGIKDTYKGAEKDTGWSVGNIPV